jgi:hypothetical protein
VPRKKTGDDEGARRRRGASAVAVEAERGLALRILLHSPMDTLAGLIAFAACSAIIANALFLQSGPHPAPMFGLTPTPPTPASPLPRPRPADADASSSEPRLGEMRPAEPRLSEFRPADPLSNLVKSAGSPTPATITLRPPALIPPQLQITGSRRVAAVQRVLTEYGYGQLKPTGTIGPDTQAAITKFERDHKMPVTGQVSDRLVRELSAAIGHPIE